MKPQQISVTTVSGPTTPEEIDQYDSQTTAEEEEGEVEIEWTDDQKRRIARLIREAQCEVARRLVFRFAEANNPRLTAYQFLYALGLNVAAGGSASSIAKKFGITKQAFEQGMEREQDALFSDFRANPLEKGKEASRSYQLSNYRKAKQ